MTQTKSRSAMLGKVPGQTARDHIKGNQKYHGPLPDFTGQLRINTGVQDMGRDRIILIKESQLETKRLTYPNLIVLGKVQQ